jgi:hypothetical protein
MRNNEPITLPVSIEGSRRLEERSQQANSVAPMTRGALNIIIGMKGALGGFSFHLPNQQIALTEQLGTN